MRPYQQRFDQWLSMFVTGVAYCVLAIFTPVLAAQTDPGGGIGGTGITGFGVVQKFGSIFVNGREFFFDESTQVSREGIPTNQEALRLGDVVTVQGKIEKNPRAGIIKSVDVRVALQGRAEDIDEAGGTFHILGQTVRVGPGTYGEAGTTAFSIGKVRVGEMVAVCGLIQADGAWMATRVSPWRTRVTDEFIVHGNVAAMDRNKGTVTIGRQSFAIGLSGFSSYIQPGDSVRIVGFYDHEKAVVTAIRGESPLATAGGRLIEMSGYVQAITSADRARANEVTLRYGAVTVVVNGKVGDLRPNTPIAVRGELNSDGSISVHEMVVDVDPRDAALPELQPALREPVSRENQDRAGKGDSETERPDSTRPETEKPEIEKPDIERPEIERPELPSIEQ